MAKRQKRRASRGNRIGMAGIAVVVLTLLAVLLVQSHRLENKNTAYAGQVTELEQQIAEQEARAEELEKLPEYTQSQEKMAREKFGLVYPDEVIFRAEE